MLLQSIMAQGSTKIRLFHILFNELTNYHTLKEDQGGP